MTRFASVVLVDRRGWVLLQERDEHTRIDPETWSFCGGHIEEGEDAETAAYRELEEETGIRLAPGELRLWEVARPIPGEDCVIALYVAAVDLADDDIECREGRQIVFVDPTRALRLRLGRAAVVLLPRLLDSELYRELAP